MCLFLAEKEWKSLRYDSKNSHNHQSQYSVHNRIKISAWTESNQWRQIWRFYKLIPLVAVEFPQTPCTLYTASNGKLIEFLLICWNVRYFSYTCKTLCCSFINDGTLTEGGAINNTLTVNSGSEMSSRKFIGNGGNLIAWFIASWCNLFGNEAEYE